MKKTNKPIEITSVTTTFEPVTLIKEPIYLNKFSVSAKSEHGSDFPVIAEQFSSFSIVNEDSTQPLLELTIEVNEGLVYDILNSGIQTKTLSITYENRKKEEILNMDYNIIYRGFSGLVGSYESREIMKIKLYYQIQNQTINENDRKIRVR
jgi:hypothetical protein